MSLVDSLKALHAVRNDRQIVVPTMGSAREWMTLGTHPLDFIYAPSAMGHAPSLGLGLALAQPEKQVIVLNGDGCLLMNLGCLATIAAVSPTNFVLIVCDNGVYEVTGGQALPGSDQEHVAFDYATIARGCGFRHIRSFDVLEQWQAELPRVLAEPGPTLIVLRVAPVPGGAVPKSPAPPKQRAREFSRTLTGPRRTLTAAGG
jgi:thiamine pyrophosphate-dependent acetolactate synthase large subunit-like protein